MKKKASWSGILASRFYRIYFAVVAVCLVAIAIGLLWLRGVVRDYEVSQPIHAAEVVARLFEQGDYASLYALDTSAREISGGDQAAYVDSLGALTQGKDIGLREAFSTDPNEKKYAVTLEGDKLATFTLVPSGETTGHGNALWKLGTLTTHVALEGSGAAEAAAAVSSARYRVSAPAGYAVAVDGRALTGADAVRTGIPILPEDFLPSGVVPPTMTEYAFDSENPQPDISVTDEGGAAAQVLPDGENAWKCPLMQNAAFRDQYGPAVIKLAERIAKYTVKDLSRSSITGNCASDSPAEDILKKFSNSWAPPHKTATMTDAEVSDFYVLSDDCFTCHVKFTFTLRTRRGNDYVYPTEYTFCVVKRKGEGKLYNLLFN